MSYEPQPYYPAWICQECGDKYGKTRRTISTFHIGSTCGWCGRNGAVTEPRDFGYPDYPAHDSPKRAEG